jgi:membrane protease YdiL (CAAX protease family)
VIDPLVLPLTRLPDVSVTDALLGYAPVKALLPIPVLIAIAPVILWFFRSTWRKLDAEAAEFRARALASAKPPARLARLRLHSRLDRRPRLHLRRRMPRSSGAGQDWATAAWATYQRPAACLVITAVVLTLQEYYGGRHFYLGTLQPWLASLEQQGLGFIELRKWDELYGYGWWVLARLLGYVVVPFPLWKLLFPQDSLLDMGLRAGGLLRHAWIYLLCLAVVLPLLLLVARQPDFANYYPFYKKCSRSWVDFALWEGLYVLQFLGLEMFFRGWMVGALRKTMGSGAIFAMSVPYCMIHYGKPFLEANGAIVAGIVLGSLAMRTKSIYSGFLVHITVALLMDFLALSKGLGLPTQLWPG